MQYNFGNLLEIFRTMRCSGRRITVFEGGGVCGLTVTPEPRLGTGDRWPPQQRGKLL